MKTVVIPTAQDSKGATHTTTEGARVIVYRSPRVESVTPPGVIHEGFASLDEAEQALGLTKIPRPPAPAPNFVPAAVTPRQLRLQLLTGGVTPAMVQASLEAIPDPAQREAALIEWEYASEVRRDHPLVASLAGALGYTTSAQVDQLFRAAYAL